MVDVVKIARALGDPTRYAIMLLLARFETGCCPQPGREGQPPGLCNCEIMEHTGMIQSRVSYHMKELTGAGLVTEEQRGRWKYYYINPAVLDSFTRQVKQDLAPGNLPGSGPALD